MSGGAVFSPFYMLFVRENILFFFGPRSPTPTWVHRDHEALVVLVDNCATSCVLVVHKSQVIPLEGGFDVKTKLVAWILGSFQHM